MLAFYGYVGKNVELIDPNNQSLQCTLTDKGIYKYNFIKTSEIFLAFSDFRYWGAQQPVGDTSTKVYALATGHLYEWSDGKPNSSDKELSHEVLKVYLEKGINALHGCKGKYSVVIIDQRYELPGKVYLIKDRLGYSPLYYSYNADGIHFATFAESIGVCGLYKPQLNIDAIAQAFYMGIVFEGNSFFKEVNNLAGNQMIAYSQGMSSLTDCHARLEWPEEPAAHYTECIDVLAESMLNAVRRLGAYSQKPLKLLLSGGADSRLILYCLLQQGYHFYATSKYDEYEDEPDVSTAQELQRVLGFDLKIEKNIALNKDVITNMSGRIFATLENDSHAIRGHAYTTSGDRWNNPLEVKNYNVAENAFKGIIPFTKEFLAELSCEIREMSDLYIKKRTECSWEQKKYAHNMSVYTSTFLRSTETDTHARPQGRFLGTFHMPYLDEEVVIATSKIPKIMPLQKIKLFNEVFRRYFPKYPYTPIVHKFTSKKFQRTTSKVNENNQKQIYKLKSNNDEFCKDLEGHARKLLMEPSCKLLGTIISENCLKAVDFPIQFSLSIIFWNNWQKLYFPSF
jgi:hypothetical protein